MSFKPWRTLSRRHFFADKADKFRTPAKPKREKDDIGPFGGNWQFSPYQHILPIDDPSGLKSIIGPEGTMNSQRRVDENCTCNREGFSRHWSGA